MAWFKMLKRDNFQLPFLYQKVNMLLVYILIPMRIKKWILISLAYQKSNLVFLIMQKDSLALQILNPQHS